jgi:alanine-glyoxylate transaminase/serine-glyoxylate transaminase/serine-pyruvate transaminase
MLIADETDKLLMIPGPTPVLGDILEALSEPTVSHTSAYLADIIHACQDGIRMLAGTESASVFLFGGSGTLAQEAAVANLMALR